MSIYPAELSPAGKGVTVEHTLSHETYILSCLIDLNLEVDAGSKKRILEARRKCWDQMVDADAEG